MPSKMSGLTWIFLAMLLRTRAVAMAFMAERMSPAPESMTTTSMSLVGRYKPVQAMQPTVTSPKLASSASTALGSVAG